MGRCRKIEENCRSSEMIVGTRGTFRGEKNERWMDSFSEVLGQQQQGNFSLLHACRLGEFLSCKATSHTTTMHQCNSFVPDCFITHALDPVYGRGRSLGRKPAPNSLRGAPSRPSSTTSVTGSQKIYGYPEPTVEQPLFWKRLNCSWLDLSHQMIAASNLPDLVEPLRTGKTSTMRLRT